eukprot:scaffold4116_cov27-Tisochrysis_lutea.AAC.4
MRKPLEDVHCGRVRRVGVNVRGSLEDHVEENGGKSGRGRSPTTHRSLRQPRPSMQLAYGARDCCGLSGPNGLRKLLVGHPFIGCGTQ